MYLLRHNVDFDNQPILYVPTELLPGERPEGFIYGYRVEHESSPGIWQPLSTEDEEMDGTGIRVRLRTGELVCMVGADFVGEETTDARQHRDDWMEETDGAALVKPLPAGRYRLDGLVVTRRRLRRLLAVLRPDLEAALFPGIAPNEYHFWTIGGETGTWIEYPEFQYDLCELAGKGQAERPTVLFSLSYNDPLRPRAITGELRRSFCIGHYRPVPGPMALEPVDLMDLSTYWPVEALYDVLTSEELIQANLKPGPHEYL